MEMPAQPPPPQSKIKRFFSLLGPGLITGAADDDPSGIVTYSQSGAQFGFGQLWTALFMLPILLAVQEMAGRIGVVTNRGIAAIIKDHYSRKVLYALVGLLLVANTINIGADIGAMAASAQLIWNIPFTAYAIGFFALILVLEIFVSYRRYARILKWLTVSLFAYIITGLIVTRSWGEVLRATFVPHIQLNLAFLFIIVGVLGTTISPYMMFWQAGEEVEENNERAQYLPRRFRATGGSAKGAVSDMRFDTFVGMLFSEVVTWFIIVTTAVVLYSHGVTNIGTAAQAAQAIEPLVHSFPHAGKVAEILFAAGIVGTGLLAIPIFAASSSYPVSEVLSWRAGLNYKFRQAQGFYGVIIAGMAVGLLLNFIGVDPIKALVYTAVINGFVAVPIIFMLIKISGNPSVMGEHVSGTWSKVFSWIAFIGMAAAAVATVVLWYNSL
jgi:NRAMP (natural resistance-associated macrophage protein)-like metal ion transporter